MCIRDSLKAESKQTQDKRGMHTSVYLYLNFKGKIYECTSLLNESSLQKRNFYELKIKTKSSHLGEAGKHAAVTD